MKKVLLISHEASRTGAPILFLNLLHLLKSKGFDVEVLLKQDGDLKEDFEKLAKTTVLYSNGSTLLQKIKRKLHYVLVRRRLIKNATNYGLILSNTILNVDLDFFLKLNQNVFTYVHELKLVIDYYTSAAELNIVQQHTSVFLYPSENVKSTLQQKYGINKKPFKYLPYYIPDELNHKSENNSAFRKFYGVDNSKFIVGGMGAISTRKGVDLFLQTAKKVLRKNTDVLFIWCGGQEDSIEFNNLKKEIQEEGLSSVIILVPSVNNPLSYISIFNLFFLSSREDAMPLVAIESSMMKVPVLYFKGAGGIDDFLGKDAGIAAEMENTENCDELICYYYDNPEKLVPIAELARKKYEVTNSAAIVNNYLDKLFPK
jgi:glycosyltransferase involved in cell wall biosynthesis